MMNRILLILCVVPLLMAADGVALMSALASQIPTSPTEAMQWVDVVKGAGGWGVAILFGFVIWVQWKTGRADIKERDDKIFAILEKQNETVKNTIGALKGGG